MSTLTFSGKEGTISCLDKLHTNLSLMPLQEKSSEYNIQNRRLGVKNKASSRINKMFQNIIPKTHLY